MGHFEILSYEAYMWAVNHVYHFK